MKKRNVFNMLLLLGLTFGTAAVVTSCKDYDDDISNLQSQIDENKATLTELVNTKVSEINKEIESINSQIAAMDEAYKAADKQLQNAIAELKATDASQQKSIEQLAEEINTLKAECAATYATKVELQNAKAELEAAIKAAQDDATNALEKEAALEVRMAAAEANIQTAQKTADNALTLATANEARLTAAEAAIKAAQSSADKAQSSADAAQKTADEALALAKENKQTIQDVKTALEAADKNLQDQITVLGDQMTAAVARITTNEANIAANEAAIKALQTRDAELEAAIAQCKTDCASERAALESTLKSYTDAAKTELQASIDECKSNCASERAALETALKEYTDAAIADLKANLQKYADDAAANAEKNSNAYTDEAAANAEKNSNAYTDGKVNQSVTDMTNYTDAKISAVKSAYEAADAQLQVEIDALTERVAKNESDIVTIFQSIEEINNKLTWMGRKLKGMVFDPHNYYNGIEAIGLNTYKYGAYTVVKADTTKDQSTEATQAEEKIASTAKFRASYYLNPSNALVSYDNTLYNYVCNIATTRSTGDYEGISIDKVEAGKSAGMVKVTGHVADQTMIKTDDKVTVIALQYTDKGTDGKDTTITSDFAALRTYNVSNFIINKVSNSSDIKSEEKHDAAPINHLYATVAEAAAGEPMFNLAYTDATINFDEWINVHATIGESSDVYFGDQPTLNEEDFRLKYELIGYKVDGLQQSWVATIDNTTIKANGLKKSIGYTPMVRVTMVDEANNNAIVAVGYFKVKIDGTSKEISDTKEVEYNLACTAAGDDYVVSATYLNSDMIEEVLMSKEEFKKSWKLDVDANGNAKQFKDENGTTTTSVGKVVATGDYSLTWSLKNGEAYNAFKSNTSTSVIVRYTDGTDYIYATLTMTVKEAVGDPSSIKIANSSADKVSTVWFARNSKDAGYADLHAHVQEAAAGQTDEYVFNVADAGNWQLDGTLATPLQIMQAKLTGTKYETLANDLQVRYYFAAKQKVTTVTSAKDGSEYTIIACNDETYTPANEKCTILAANDPSTGKSIKVAEIDPVSGVITYNKDSEIALDILNYASHKKLADGETFNATIQMVAIPCQPVAGWDCADNFDVKFLRPINFSNNNTSVVDGDPSTYSAITTLNFTDWRDWDPTTFSANTNRRDFFDYYGIVSVVNDGSRNILTNYVDGTNFKYDANLNDYFTFDITWPEPISGSKEKATVLYSKKKALALHSFQAKVPVVVEYTWGKLYDYIIVTVNSTTGGNSVKARK